MAGEKTVPVQNGALLQHWLATVHPVPEGRHGGGPHTPLLQVSPLAQSPVSMQRWPLIPAVRWQVVGAPAVAPRQNVALAQHSLKVAQGTPVQEVITPASIGGTPASAGAVPASVGVVQRFDSQARPVQQSLVLVQATVAPPQLARHLRRGEAVVPRQLGYAAQQPPFAYEAVQLSPEAQTRIQPSGSSWPASKPASTTPASATPASRPASMAAPASELVPASSRPASTPASRSRGPPSVIRMTQSLLVHCSPGPQTSQAPVLPQASSVFPLRQVVPTVQPEQVVEPPQKPSWQS